MASDESIAREAVRKPGTHPTRPDQGLRVIAPLPACIVVACTLTEDVMRIQPRPSSDYPWYPTPLFWPQRRH